MSTNFAILVGVESYITQSLSKINVIPADLSAIYAWIVHPSGGNVPLGRLAIVRNASALADLQLPATQFLTEAKNIGGADKIYLYFTGHGLSGGSSDAHFCFSTWTTAHSDNVATASTIVGSFINSGLFKHVIAFFDCCRSDPPVKNITASVRLATIFGHSNIFSGALTTFACGDLSEAFYYSELDIMPQISVFTHVMTTALWGDASQVGGGVVVQDFVNYLTAHTLRLPPTEKSKQIPDTHTQGTILQATLGTTHPTRTTTFVSPVPLDRPITLVTPKGLMPDLALGDAGMSLTLTLSKGLHLMYDRRRQVLFSSDIKAHPQTLTVDLSSPVICADL